MSPLSIAFLALSLTAPSAADWPQWRGPNRDGVSAETGLLKTWPKDGPKLLWTVENAGLGYCSFSVVGDRLYTMGAVDDKNGDKEFVLAIDTTTGKEVWREQIGTFFKNNWGGGPRGTPTVDGNLVYALGGNGDLVCLDRSTGKTVWKKNFKTDFNGQQQLFWGYSESVLVDGDNVIGVPGGPDGTIVALNKKTGDKVWRSTDLKDLATYSSLVIANIGGTKQYVTMTNTGTVAVRASDGKKLWSNPLGANSTAVIPTPVVAGDTVYVTSGYNGTSGLLKIKGGPDEFTAEKAYETTKSLKNHHGGVIKVGDYVYGHSDTDRGQWVCIDFKTGTEKWKKEAKAKESLDKGSLVYADGSFYALGQQSGTCVKFAASPDGWKEEGRFTLPKRDDANRSKSGGIWSHPVVAGGRLYLRDQNYLFCFDLTGKN
jgi:outer membrane protein assembly factor BamB